MAVHGATAGPLNILPPHSRAVSATALLDHHARPIVHIEDILIVGTSLSEDAFHVTQPLPTGGSKGNQLVLMALHDPPGGASYAVTEGGSRYHVDVNFDQGKGLGC